MGKTLKNIVIGATLASAILTGCSKPHQEVEQNQIRAGKIVIEDIIYRATLTDRDGDGRNDAFKIERKFPAPYGSREPLAEYFVTSLPRFPENQNGVVIHIVKPEFFEQYGNIFDPNRDSIISSYGQ